MRARAAKVARYNERLRAAYHGREPVFDLAAYESAGGGGGADAPFLHAAYTDDGEHLNELGRKTVARRFVHFLADSVAPLVDR
jgi:lysophospholipase L1-like esterase